MKKQKRTTKKEIKVKERDMDYEYLFIGIFIGMIVALMFVQLEVSPQWVTRDTLNETLYNNSVIAYQIGLDEGQQLTLVNILNTTITCQETFQINAGNQSFNLVLVECLNLNRGLS